MLGKTPEIADTFKTRMKDRIQKIAFAAFVGIFISYKSFFSSSVILQVFEKVQLISNTTCCFTQISSACQFE